MQRQWDRWIDLMLKGHEQGGFSADEQEDFMAFLNHAQNEKRKLDDQKN